VLITLCEEKETGGIFIFFMVANAPSRRTSTSTIGFMLLAIALISLSKSMI
jgi:hypothetical protein